LRQTRTSKKISDTAKITAGKPNTQNSQETDAPTKLLRILIQRWFAVRSGVVRHRWCDVRWTGRRASRRELSRVAVLRRCVPTS